MRQLQRATAPSSGIMPADHARWSALPAFWLSALLPRQTKDLSARSNECLR